VVQSKCPHCFVVWAMADDGVVAIFTDRVRRVS